MAGYPDIQPNHNIDFICNGYRTDMLLRLGMTVITCFKFNSYRQIKKFKKFLLTNSLTLKENLNYLQ